MVPSPTVACANKRAASSMLNDSFSMIFLNKWLTCVENIFSIYRYLLCVILCLYYQNSRCFTNGSPTSRMTYTQTRCELVYDKVEIPSAGVFSSCSFPLRAVHFRK